MLLYQDSCLMTAFILGL
uniref:Uncharacterized protein n=1 Tax=Rhizophora mucronata TaxID=61149 RepID=A0A2P2P2D2_RHIMU